jgi:hypothetical protein
MGTKPIFNVSDGYIVTESKFNSVNYNGDRMSIHVRMCDVENPSYEYMYDRIYILDSRGKVIGHFWFRDFAVYISGVILGFYKHWKYFKFYFNMVEQVYVTEKRLVMIFPTCSPLGLKVVETANFIYEIHPEYLPENKIKSSVISYNFNQDKDNSDKDKDYVLTDLMFNARDMFYYDNGDDIGAWNHLMNFSFLRMFSRMQAEADEDAEPTYLYQKMEYLNDCFEPILSLPDSLLDMKGIAEDVYNHKKDNPYADAVPPAKTFMDLTTSRDVCDMTAYMHAAGFWYFPVVQPTMTYVGSDSVIAAVNIKAQAIDSYLDANLRRNEMLEKGLSEHPEIANAINTLEALSKSFSQSNDISFSKYSNNIFDVFVRVGPHCYLYTTGTGITFPSIDYAEQYFFFNEKKVASGDRNYLKGQILNLYGEKFVRIGFDIYKQKGEEPGTESPKSALGTEDRESQEMVLFKSLSQKPFITKFFNSDMLLSKEDDDTILMADWLNRRYIKHSDTDIEPVLTYGDECLVGVHEQGSLNQLAIFYSLRTTLPHNEKETPEENITEWRPDSYAFYYFKAINREILELQPGYQGFFAKVDDGNAEEWIFMTNYGMTQTIKNIYNNTPEEWYQLDISEMEANENDGWCDFPKFIEEDKKDHREKLELKLDSIKVIGGELI